MPRYYFRLWRGFKCEEDPEGMELSDVHAAQAEASRVIQELLQDWSDGDPEPLDRMSFEIVDEKGRTLLTVPFARRQGAKMPSEA
ncbi:DUF6894 family protein [Microvirga lenta]|uniref:DUF6894 family protein n=1 Tax=Microvirga lenta TaxID=2881337 RepID=UPI001CFF579D|nr:hypothetical protein [Microvirga lenta]MCB5176629.1 hypothetical protein [Microvirga lenta]